MKRAPVLVQEGAYSFKFTKQRNYEYRKGQIRKGTNFEFKNGHNFEFRKGCNENGHELDIRYGQRFFKSMKQRDFEYRKEDDFVPEGAWLNWARVWDGQRVQAWPRLSLRHRNHDKDNTAGTNEP